MVNEINLIIERQLWMDFQVTNYDGYSLTIVGCLSLSFPDQYEIKIYFRDVFFVSLPMDWKTDTSKIVLSLLEADEAGEINWKFQVESGYHIFRFKPEDYPDDFGCLIGAREISYKLREKNQ